jgi:hypothetical protein
MLGVLQHYTGISPVGTLVELACASLAGDEGLERMQAALATVAQGTDKAMDLKGMVEAAEMLSGEAFRHTVYALEAARRARERLLDAVMCLQTKYRAEAATAARVAAQAAVDAALTALAIVNLHPSSEFFPSTTAVPPVQGDAGAALVYTVKAIAQGGRTFTANDTSYTVFGSVPIAVLVVRAACRSADAAVTSASKAASTATDTNADKMKLQLSFRARAEMQRRATQLAESETAARRGLAVWNQKFYNIPAADPTVSAAELAKCVLPGTERMTAVLARGAVVPGRDDVDSGVFDLTWDDEQVAAVVERHLSSIGPDGTPGTSFYDTVIEGANDFGMLAIMVLHKAAQAVFGRDSTDETSEVSRLLRKMYPIGTDVLERESARELADAPTLEFLDGQHTRSDLATTDCRLTFGLVGNVLSCLLPWAPGSIGSEDASAADAVEDMLHAIRLGNTFPCVSLFSKPRFHPCSSAAGVPLEFHQREVDADDLVQVAHMNEYLTAMWKREHFPSAWFCAGCDADSMAEKCLNYFSRHSVGELTITIGGMIAASDTSEDEKPGEAEAVPPPTSGAAPGGAAHQPPSQTGARPRLPSNINSFMGASSAGKPDAAVKYSVYHKSRPSWATKAGQPTTTASAVKDETNRGHSSHSSRSGDRRRDDDRHDRRGSGDRYRDQRSGSDRGRDSGGYTGKYYDSRQDRDVIGHKVHESRRENTASSHSGDGYQSSGSASSGSSRCGARDNRTGKESDSTERGFAGGGAKNKKDQDDMEKWQRDRREMKDERNRKRSSRSRSSDRSRERDRKRSSLKDERDRKRSSRSNSSDRDGAKRTKGTGSGPVGCCKGLRGEFVALRRYGECAHHFGAQWAEFCAVLVHMPSFCPADACTGCATLTAPQSLPLSSAQRSHIMSLLPTSTDPEMYPFFMQGPTNVTESFGESAADAWGQKAPWVTHESGDHQDRPRSTSAAEGGCAAGLPPEPADGQPAGTPQKRPGPPADSGRQNVSPAARTINLNRINSKRTHSEPYPAGHQLTPGAAGRLIARTRAVTVRRIFVCQRQRVLPVRRGCGLGPGW